MLAKGHKDNSHSTKGKALFVAVFAAVFVSVFVFLELKVLVFKTILKLQTCLQYTDNTFFRTPCTGTRTFNKSDDSIPVMHF